MWRMYRTCFFLGQWSYRCGRCIGATFWGQSEFVYSSNASFIPSYSFKEAFAKLRTVCIEQISSHWKDFHYILYRIFFENLSRIFKFHKNLTGKTFTLHEDHYTFFIISRSFILRMRNISYYNCRGNQKLHFMFKAFFFFPNVLPFMR